MGDGCRQSRKRGLMLLCFGAGNLDVKMQGPYIATVIYHRRWAIVSADLQAYVHSRYPGDSATWRGDVQNGPQNENESGG
jgi:hypothetical protein